MTEKEKNRLAAPQATKFIDLMRETFGEANVTVQYVSEGSLKKGALPPMADRCRSEQA